MTDPTIVPPPSPHQIYESLRQTRRFGDHGEFKPNVCIMPHDFYLVFYADCRKMMAAAMQPGHELPPETPESDAFWWNGVLILSDHGPDGAWQTGVRFAYWNQLAAYGRMAELCLDLVALTVDIEAVKAGQSVDGGDPLIIQMTHKDKAADHALRQLRRILREIRSLIQ